MRRSTAIALAGAFVLMAGMVGTYIAFGQTIPRIVVFNDSNENLSLRSDRRNYGCEHGSRVEILFPVKTNRLEVQTNTGKRWHYLLGNPDSIMRGFRLYVQIEPDGKLYVVPASSTNALTTFPPQPPGFPMQPKE